MNTRVSAFAIVATVMSLFSLPAFAQTQQVYVQPRWQHRVVVQPQPVQQPAFVVQQQPVMAQPPANVVVQPGFVQPAAPVMVQPQWHQQMMLARQQTAQFTAQVQAQKAQIQQTLNASFSMGQLHPRAMRMAARINAQIDAELMHNNQNGIISRRDQFRITQLLNRMASLQAMHQQVVHMQPAQPIQVMPAQPVVHMQPAQPVQFVQPQPVFQVQPQGGGCGWNQ